jgi:hypothetical protein
MHPGGVLTEMASAYDLPDDIKRVLIDTPALPGGTAVYLSTDRARFLMGRFVSSTWDSTYIVWQEGRLDHVVAT